jgi:putative endonuclease
VVYDASFSWEFMSWYVYMVRCADASLYTGVTTDLARRIREHNSPKLAAKYTRVRQPVTLVYHEPAADRSSAQTREAALKRLPRATKETLCH